MIVWGAVCVNCASTVLRGAGTNWRMVEILWHRRETRRQTEKTKLNLQAGSNCLLTRFSLLAGASCKHYLTTPEYLCLQITPERYAKNLQSYALTEKLMSISIRGPWLGKHALKSKVVCIM